MDNEENWVEFFDSFIGLCKSSCKQIEDEKYLKEKGINIRIALIFNIKHSIELFLKSIIRMIDEDAHIKDHNLDNVFIKLKNKLEKKLKSYSFANDKKQIQEYIEQEKKEWDKGRYFVRVKDIIDYYNNCCFLDKKMKNKDIKNTFFRYPENEQKQAHNIDYFSFIYNDNFDIEKIEEDLRLLSLSFSSIKTILL